MPSAQPERNHMDAAQRRLSHLAGLASITEKTERRILEGAEQRHAQVETDIAKLRPRALQNPEAGEAYQRLTLERGQLETVIAQARNHLAAAPRDGTV